MKHEMNFMHKYAVLSICILGPFSIDIFISGIPAMMQHFPGHNVASVLSVSLLAMCLGQPFSGPLMDHYGRKPIMLIGLLLFCLSGLSIVLINDYSIFMFSKFLQTLGGSFGVVGAFAISRDISNKKELPHVIGIILALIGVSPIVAPLIGSYLNTGWGWKASFYCLLVMGLFYLCVIFCLYHETLEKKQEVSFKFAHIIMNTLRSLKVPKFTAYTIIAACAYSIIFSFLNVSPILLIKQLGISKVNYGWLVGINAVALIAMAKIAPNMVEKYAIKNSYDLWFVVHVYRCNSYVFPRKLIAKFSMDINGANVYYHRRYRYIAAYYK